MIVIAIIMIIVLISVVIIRKIHTYSMLKKMLGEQIKSNIRSDNTFTFDQWIEKYGGGDE